MRWTLALLLGGGLLATGVTGYAHHSFAGTYFEEDVTTIEGELVAFFYRNPHSFVHVMAPDENGEVQRWAIEWGGVAQLNRAGVNRFTLKPGDNVVVRGAPARNPEDHRLLMRNLERPADGFTWGGRVD